MMVSKLVGRSGWTIVFVFATGMLVVAWAGHRQGDVEPRPIPMKDWDIPRLADYLNEKGLNLLVRPTHESGPIAMSAYLLTDDRPWLELNRLVKTPDFMGPWRGTLYCEWGGEGRRWDNLASQWGDCYLVAGPFIFFGDRELLARVRAVLFPSAA